MSYTKSYTAWQDFPNVSTPATAAKLQNMDDGISTAVTSVSAISATISAVSAQAYGSILKSVGSASGDIIYFSGPSTPTRLAIGASTYVLSSSGGLPKWIAPTSTTVTATNSSKALSADVTMTNANQYYDGPSLSLGAGTWLLLSTVTVVKSGSTGKFTAKIWDGSTVQVSSEVDTATSSGTVSISLQCTVTLGSTTTMKTSVACQVATGTILAAAPTNSAGNNASTLYAVQIA